VRVVDGDPERIRERSLVEVLVEDDARNQIEAGGLVLGPGRGRGERDEEDGEPARHVSCSR